MYKSIILLSLSVLFFACASKPAHNTEMLEKYPQCYHINIKIEKDCINKNESGTKTTAVDLENSAYAEKYQ